ncbi:MAG: formimidoylglutamate deiminase, partial [Thermomicrobiales bacterium]
ARNVRIGVEAGLIRSIETGCSPGSDGLSGSIAIPGIPDIHSHAFQRGMAGLAEVRGSSEDTFWTWREVMYRFALSMSPEQMQVIASQAYIEMLESGFTRVGEFHYLHHDRDGSPYDDVAELAERIAAAADETGIGLTLLPVFYAHSTFGGEAPAPGQRRFITNLDSFAKLVDRCQDIVGGIDGAILGVAPHSLRAVTPDELATVVQLAPQGPIHMHIAEQDREVTDCLAWSGQRPVSWLLDRFEVDARWCLIHATHLTAQEAERLAKSGAVAGLCPITEANLGDGIFPGSEFTAHGGRYGIGTDSNVLISLPSELRQLEYAQRLARGQRNVLAVGPGSTGRALFDAALAGGSQSLGVHATGIAIGARADFVTLNTEHPDASHGDTMLDTWVFAGAATVKHVWVGGKQVVVNGRHLLRDSTSSRYRSTIRELIASN